MTEWRLLDTGVRTGAENMALDDAILECRALGLTPDTLRFLQFSPPTVLVGFHQSIAQEVRLDYCRAHGIDINRRITGGGAILFTPLCLGWEIYGDRNSPVIGRLRNDLDELAQMSCLGTIEGLRRLGVEANFRPKNDIEIRGRKISGTGGTQRGDAFMYQGTLLIDFDVDLMLKTLRIPIEKLQDKEVESVKERVTWLKREIGYTPPLAEIKNAIRVGFEEVLGVTFKEQSLTSDEERIFKEYLPSYQSEDWIDMVRPPKEHAGHVTAVRKTPGGLIRVSLTLNVAGNFIVNSFITGDFQVFPQRAIMDLEARLKNISADEESVRQNVLDFFEETGTRIFGVRPEHIIQLLLEAIKKTGFAKIGVSLEDSNYLMSVNFMPDEVLEQHFDFLLLPYCAKLLDCEFRRVEGCNTCGACSMGDIYGIAQELDIPVRTIQNFEHLIETIEEFKRYGARGYIGSCCQGFYCKHHDDFVKTGMPALLIDVDDSTCYELGEQKAAYAGAFEGQTTLRTDLLLRVIRELKRLGRIGSSTVLANARTGV